VYGLKLVQDLYIKKLKELKIIKDETLKIIFSEIVGIYNVNKFFFDELQKEFDDMDNLLKHDQIIIGNLLFKAAKSVFLN
jgi:hypothetical protein